MEIKTFDVIQVGYGPVGQTMAYLLGDKGHNIAVFERWPSVFALPRAAAFDHEIMRVFQEIGIAKQVEEKIIPLNRYQWVNAKRDLLLEVPYGGADVSGWENGYLMYQPNVEKLLDQKVKTLDNVEVYQGWQVEKIDQLDDYIEVTVRKGEVPEPGKWIGTEETQVFRTKYLIGADGANSLVKNTLEIGQKDLGFGELFAVIDFKPNNPLILDHLPEAYQVCDPKRPTTIIKRLGSEHIRFEFMILPHEDSATFLEEENIHRLISSWITHDDGEIIRKTIYKFSSTLADKWTHNNIFLIGDAAHLTPPFMGQGMCSGIRDVKNLVWKLDMVLNGILDYEVLKSYQSERYPHSETLIQMAVDLGRVICVPDEAEAAKRDALFMEGKVPPMPSMPGLVDGILYRDHNGDLQSNSGMLSLQAIVQSDGKKGLFDDVVSKGWNLLTFDENIEEYLTEQQKSTLKLLDINISILSKSEKPDLIYDINHSYEQFFVDHKITALLVRPDFYAFGSVENTVEVSNLIDNLLAQLPIKEEVFGVYQQ